MDENNLPFLLNNIAKKLRRK